MPGKQELEAFAARLKECLALENLTHIDLAYHFDINEKSPQKWLKAEAWPQFGRIVQIADLLKVNVEWLITGKGSRLPMTESTPKYLATTDPERELLDRFRGFSEQEKKVFLDLARTFNPNIDASILDDIEETEPYNSSSK